MKNKNVTKTVKHEEKLKDGYIYSYTLNVAESASVASYKLPLYSITVELTNPSGDKTRAQTKEIFADVGKAFSFFEKLVRNLATPIDLVYVVEDEISC